MSLVPVREYTSAEEMMAAYRARLRPKQPVVAIELVTPLPPEPEPEPEIEPEPAVEVTILDEAIARYRLAFDSGFSLEGSRSCSKQIIHEVAQEEGLTVDDLKGVGRSKPLALARQRAMWLIAQRTSLSLPQIGRLFGRDHTTALHSIRVMNRIHGMNVRGCGTDDGKVAARKKWLEARQ